MKRFEEYGIASSPNIIREALQTNTSITNMARGYTYTTLQNEYPSTRLAFDGNPFNKQILEAKNVLEIGTGTGRNIPWIMENTNAHYYGVEPNPVMLESLWDVTDRKWQPRCTVVNDWNKLPYHFTFDVVISIFVFQHLGYRSPPGVMNVTDLTQEAMKHTRPGTVWIVYEHEREEQWQSRWMNENGIVPDFYDRHSHIWPELLHRGDDSNLIIWKQSN